MSETLSQERVLTADDIRCALADPSVCLEGRITKDALRPFVTAVGDCEFSEVMAEGTDSWLNRVHVSLGIDRLNISRITGLDEAKASLKASLSTTEIMNLVSATEGAVRVALDEQGAISFNF